MEKNMKRFLSSIIYIIILIFIMIKAEEWERYFKLITLSNYNSFPYIIFSSVYPVMIGLLLALPNFINKIRKIGSWNIDWINLIAIGIPTLYGAISPILYFSPLSTFLPKLTSYFFSYSLTPQVICGVIFGYIFLSVFDKTVN